MWILHAPDKGECIVFFTPHAEVIWKRGSNVGLSNLFVLTFSLIVMEATVWKTIPVSRDNGTWPTQAHSLIQFCQHGLTLNKTKGFSQDFFFFLHLVIISTLIYYLYCLWGNVSEPAAISQCVKGFQMTMVFVKSPYHVAFEQETSCHMSWSLHLIPVLADGKGWTLEVRWTWARWAEAN